MTLKNMRTIGGQYFPNEHILPPVLGSLGMGQRADGYLINPTSKESSAKNPTMNHAPVSGERV